MAKTSKNKDYQARVRNLIEKHGWKLNVPPSMLDDEDRAGLGGGLRCFRMVQERDDYGEKLETQKRCGNPARKGSFYCKKHGGGNQHALIHGERSMVASAFRGAMKMEVGALFDAFLNDPTLMDLKPQLSALNTCLTMYIRKVSADCKKVSNAKRGLKAIKQILRDDMCRPSEKFDRIQALCAAQASLTDGEVVDRITRMIDTISKIVERIDKVSSKEEFQLTPDGLKIVYRTIIEIIQKYITNQAIMKQLKEDLIQSSTRVQAKPELENAQFKMID